MDFSYSLTAVNAQPYIRTTFNDVYTPITLGGGATVSTATGDNASEIGVALGFVFNYAGVNYTSISINTNGMMFFDPLAPTPTESANNSSLFQSTIPNQTIAPWWNNLSDDANSDILYQTQGSAGNKTFTVQYTNYPTYTGVAGTNVRMNCQAIFYEATGNFEFRYGTLNITGEPSYAAGACIGIEYGSGGLGNYIDAITGSNSTNNIMLYKIINQIKYGI